MKQTNRVPVLFDGLLIILNIINGGLSVLPMLLLFNSVPYNLVLVTLLNLAWCVFNSNYIKQQIFPKALIPYFMVLAYQILLGRFEFSITMLLLNVSFFFLLCGLLGKYRDKTVDVLTNSYIAYSFINVIGVCLAFFLILQGVLEPFSNSIEVSILAKDDEVAFFPGYLSVLRPDDAIRVAFLPTFGLFCGYSHEPHVVGYICIPAFFFLLYKLKEKKKLWLSIICVALYALFFLITLSATSFISISIVTFVGLFLSGRNRGNKKSWIILAVLVVGIISAAAMIGDTFSFVFDKVNAEGGSGSRDYSVARIDYAFKPSTVFGTTVYSTSVDGDIGVITAILNFSFYISMGVLCARLLLSKNKRIFYYGLALLYFSCHSMKAFLMIYRYPYTLYIIFLCYFVLQAYNNERRKDGLPSSL